MDRDLEREAWDKARLSLSLYLPLSFSRYSLMEFSNAVHDAGSIIRFAKIEIKRPPLSISEYS